jgi:O-antigen/teichoic acid export membrane protein
VPPLRRYAGRLSAASAPPIIEFAARFARTIILSRLLEPTDLGAAVALGTILASCEMLADVGLTQFVMVNVGADRAPAVAAVQQIGIIRGILLAALILLLAPWLASLFGASGHVDSIRWLGIVPLVRSFKNWRTVQIQSEYIYRPEAISIGGAQVGAAIAVLPAAVWFHDERAMLVSLIVEAALYVVVSRLALPRERVAAVDPAVRRMALTFGLPLMANGIGLIMLAQADRIIVSNLFGLEVLALYSLVVSLASVPISVLSLILGKVLMTFIVRSRDEPTEARQASLITVWLPFVTAASYALAVGALLDLAVPLLYGQRYQVTVGLHALVTLMVFSRICRIGPTAILLAHSQTGHVTAANLISGLGLITGFVLGIFARRVEAVMLGVLLGDVLSLVAMLKLTSPRLPARTALNHLALLTLPAVLAAAGAVAEGGFGLEARVLIVTAGAVAIGLDIVMVYQRSLAGFLAKQ